jgi:hypothetical protein
MGVINRRQPSGFDEATEVHAVLLSPRHQLAVFAARKDGTSYVVLQTFKAVLGGNGWAETERRVVVQATDVEPLVVALRAADARTRQPGVLV